MFPIVLPRPARIPLLAASTILLTAFPARAAVTTFARFTHDGVSGLRSFNDAAGATLGAGCTSWQFDGLNIGRLPPDLPGDRSATLTLCPGACATGTFTPDGPGFSHAAHRVLGLSFPAVLASLSMNGAHSITAGAGAINPDPVPLVAPEADARPALGYLVGVAGLWEIFRRLRSGWARAGREEEIRAA